MSSKPTADSIQRLGALKNLLLQGELSTQEEFCDALKSQGFEVTQSTVSRDLTRLSAIKARDTSGRIVYRLPKDNFSLPSLIPKFKGLITNIQHNGTTIVIHTTPGSASLVARQLDTNRPEGILGTIAGDDTIFVAPSHPRKIDKTIKAILAEFN